MTENKNAGLTFRGGKNIAMKVPTHQYDSTVLSYRDVLGFEEIERHLPSVVFAFGNNNLRIYSPASIINLVCGEDNR